VSIKSSSKQRKRHLNLQSVKKSVVVNNSILVISFTPDIISSDDHINTLLDIAIGTTAHPCIKQNVFSLSNFAFFMIVFKNVFHDCGH